MEVFTNDTDIREFRNALGQFSTGVTIITANGEQMVGLTANSFTSVSLTPALVLVCIDNRSKSIDIIKEGITFAINVLSKEQEELCWKFAKSSDDKFANTPYYLDLNDVPVLQGNIATFICKVDAIYPGGDHQIVVGEVQKFSYETDKSPLLFFRGKIEV